MRFSLEETAFVNLNKIGRVKISFNHTRYFDNLIAIISKKCNIKIDCDLKLGY